MSTNFPSSLDSIPNPTATDLLENATAALDHDAQHANANDAIEALQAKVGADSSIVTTSHDYKLGEVTGTDKAVGKSATQTLTNKTLTAPKITAGGDAKGDIFQLSDTAGVLARIRATLNSDIISWNSSTQQWEAIPNPAGSNSSTTVKGVVEEATLAETLARTATGGTGARTFVSPSNMPAVLYHDYAADAVGTDSYAITVNPVPTAYVTGDIYVFKAGTVNTGPASLNVNSLGAISILRADGSALANGDISANQIVMVAYNGTSFLLVSPVANGPKFSHGVTTFDTSSVSTTTTVIAHGLGRAPRFVRLSAYLGAGTYTQATAEGSYDGSATAGIFTGSNNSVDRSGTSTTNVLTIISASTTSKQEAVISVDATNITLTWTKTGTNSGIAPIRWNAQV